MFDDITIETKFGNKKIKSGNIKDVRDAYPFIYKSLFGEIPQMERCEDCGHWFWVPTQEELNKKHIALWDYIAHKCTTCAIWSFAQDLHERYLVPSMRQGEPMKLFFYAQIYHILNGQYKFTEEQLKLPIEVEQTDCDFEFEYNGVAMKILPNKIVFFRNK